MSKSNKIEDNLIAAVVKETDSIFFKLLDDYPSLDKNDCRQMTFLHAMMTNCMIQLYGHDYTIKDVIDEAFQQYEIYEEIVQDIEDKE
jgi:uncharacterized protein with von Willebrand factor type A (vWA) domain